MNKKSLLLLFFLETKAALSLLPRLFLTLCFSLLFACGVVYAGSKFLEKPEDIRIPAALVLPENDTYAGLAFSFLERMNSVRKICSFERTDAETALARLKAGEVCAVILIPDNFIEYILDGTNSAATLLLPRKGSLESILFCTLAESGVSTLSTAQAGIYAVEDTLIAYERWDSLSKAEEELNKRFLSYALNRGQLFCTETVSATGTLSLTRYYICSAAVMLFLLSGMGHYGYLRAEPESLILCMRRQGISPFLLLLSKLIAVTGIYTLFLFPIMAGTGLLQPHSLSGFFILILSVQSFLLSLGSLCPQAGSYVIVSASLSVVLLFLSGAFVPSVFLPDAVRQLGQLMPTALYLKLCRELLTDSFSFLSAVYGTAVGLLFLILSVLFRRRQY